MADNELIAGLEEAVTAAPGNVPLRLHLVEHLVGVGRAAEGLAHVEAILRAQPDNLAAFIAAASAAAAAKDPRNAAYARVAHALRLAAGDEPRADPPAPTPVAGPAPVAAPAPQAPEPVGEMPSSPADDVTEQGAPDAEPPAEVAEDPDIVDAAPADDETPDEAPRAEFTIGADAIQRPRLAFKNIIGVNDVKERIKSQVIDPLRQRNGHGMGGGYLMYGPPGCGKGFFARVVAGEIGASFLPVKLGDAAQWPGDPRQNIHKVFEAAREAAPCVLFLDEVDMAGQDPSNPDEPIDRGLVARLVTELDTAAANRGVYVFAGAVSPWNVDMALRDEGRLDRSVLVLPPDEPAREAILRFHLKDTPLSGLDVTWIVQRTQHFSGDDLLALCERATELAASDALGGRVAIGTGHVTRALREVRPTAPGWFSSAMDQAVVANHGGLYDDVLAYIDAHQLV
jgi:AAA+ superfamily predicted ATPase